MKSKIELLKLIQQKQLVNPLIETSVLALSTELKKPSKEIEEDLRFLSNNGFCKSNFNANNTIVVILPLSDKALKLIE